MSFLLLARSCLRSFFLSLLNRNSYLAKLATFLLDSNFLAFESSCLQTFYSNRNVRSCYLLRTIHGSDLVLINEPLGSDFILSCGLLLSFFLAVPPGSFILAKRLASVTYYHAITGIGFHA
ncbi:hypothetical protein Hanom_Chr10g00901001 [Helianthus anomalus]